MGFYDNGVIQRRFKNLMQRMSQMDGWFVPVSTLLDYLLEVQGDHAITLQERNQLERRWLKHKLLYTFGRS
jgi:hypothetical protein